jgi:protein SCO1/2
MNKNAYIAITFVILIFGIWAVPKIVARFNTNELVKFEQVPSFKFENQYGAFITNKDYENKVYLVEFFFTSCPTICPIMNENMVKIQNEFYGNPSFGIVSISIDPERDSPSVLKAYADQKGATLKNWNFLTGEKDEIYSFSNDGFKLYAGENKDAEGGFEHSGLFALIDKDGFIRSRTVMNGENENPIKFYDGLDDKQIQGINEDIQVLLNEK